MSMSKTDIPLADADATSTRGKEDPSPIPGADADTEEAVTAAPVGVTFEVEGDKEEEGEDKLGNEDKNPREYVTWESRDASYQFPNNPMRHCVWILLVLRAVQMGINFGTNFIESGFLTGELYKYKPPQISSSILSHMIRIYLLLLILIYCSIIFHMQAFIIPLGIRDLALPRLIPSLVPAWV